MKLCFGSGRSPSGKGSGKDVAHTAAGPKLDPIALFGVRLGRGTRLGFALLVLKRDHGGANLALKVRRAAFDGVEFGALLVGQLIDAGQFGHTAAFF